MTKERTTNKWRRLGLNFIPSSSISNSFHLTFSQPFLPNSKDSKSFLSKDSKTSVNELEAKATKTFPSHVPTYCLVGTSSIPSKPVIFLLTTTFLLLHSISPIMCSREHYPSAGSPRDLGSQAGQPVPLQHLSEDPVQQAGQPLPLQHLPEDQVKPAGRSLGARRPKTVMLNNNNSNSINYNNNNIQHTAINIEDPAPSENVVVRRRKRQADESTSTSTTASTSACVCPSTSTVSTSGSSTTSTTVGITTTDGECVCPGEQTTIDMEEETSTALPIYAVSGRQLRRELLDMELDQFKTKFETKLFKNIPFLKMYF